MDESKNLEGLGGWLIIICIGLILSPLYLITSLVTDVNDIIFSGMINNLFQENSDYFYPELGILILFELIVNIGLLISWLYMTYLFFTKNYLFPKWYISVAVAALFIQIIDISVLKFLLPEVSIIEQGTLREFLRSVFTVIIWVPYMLSSERVKNTFINGKAAANPITQTF